MSAKLAVVILGQRGIFDLPTGLIALASLLLLWRFKLPEPLIVLLSGVMCDGSIGLDAQVKTHSM